MRGIVAERSELMGGLFSASKMGTRVRKKHPSTTRIKSLILGAQFTIVLQIGRASKANESGKYDDRE
jgi:hypothetical protein